MALITTSKIYVWSISPIYFKKQRSLRKIMCWDKRRRLTSQMTQHRRCNTVYRDTLRSAVSVGSQNCWFRCQLVKTVWYGFQEAGIPVRHAKTSILESQGAIPSGFNLFFQCVDTKKNCIYKPSYAENWRIYHVYVQRERENCTYWNINIQK